MKLLLALISLLPFLAVAHSGGLDKNGGHIEKSTGQYHCHKQPCYQIHDQVKKSTQEAIEEQLPISFIYKREDWKHWIDADGDCMNTRHEILKAQSIGEVKLSPDGCYVSSGTWPDPYSGKDYTRASDLDIDHVIPLKWAHEHGGANWAAQKKERFANDPRNLLAVDDALNQSKGAKGPTDWIPPNHAYRCQYLSHWQQVLELYPSLKMTLKENSTFERQLSACSPTKHYFSQ